MSLAEVSASLVRKAFMATPILVVALTEYGWMMSSEV